MTLTMISRKELAFTMLVYGILFSRTQAQNFCSCWGEFRSDFRSRPCDEFKESRSCDVWKNYVPQESLTEECDRQHSRSLRIENALACAVNVPYTHYEESFRCEAREDTYTCVFPRVIYRRQAAAIPYFGALLVKHRPNGAGVHQTSTLEVLQTDVHQHTISLRDGCTKVPFCINPPHESQQSDNAHRNNISIAFAITGSDVVIDEDVIATVFYTRIYRECTPIPRRRFPFNMMPSSP